MTPLRQRMLDAMVLRGFSPRTQESYADAIYGMAKHYRRDPAQYTAQEVEAYLLHMVQERHLSYSTMNQAACAARFLYEKVLGRERELFPHSHGQSAREATGVAGCDDCTPRDPQGQDTLWRDRRSQLYQHDWVVYAKTPLGGPAPVLEYLSRYTHRTAISN